MVNLKEISKLNSILDKAFTAPRPGLKIVAGGMGSNDPDVKAYKAREKQARQRAERRQQIEAAKQSTKLAAKFPAAIKQAITTTK